MATVKIGNIEFEVPDEVAPTIKSATKVTTGRSKEQLLKEIELHRRKLLELQKALTKEEREKAEEALRARERKYGYKAGKNAHLIKPKEYRDVDESEFADPVGFNYPVDTEKRARAALAYFIRHHNAYDDVNAKIFIYERILRALKKFGIKRHFNPDWPGDWLVSRDLKNWMEGYEKYKDEDTEEKRREMRQKWEKMNKAVEWIEKQLRAGTSHILTIAPQGRIGEEGVSESELPAALTEGLDSLLSQIAEAAVQAFGDYIKETIEKTRELFEETVEKVAETIADAVGGLAQALRDFIKELKGEVSDEELIPKKEEEEELPPVEEEAAPMPPEGGAPATSPPAGELPPAGGVPPAGAPPVEETAQRASPPTTAALAKQLGAFLTDELMRRHMQEEQQPSLNVPYIRATGDFIDSVKQSDFGRAIEVISKALVRKFNVATNERGELVLKEETESEEGK